MSTEYGTTRWWEYYAVRYLMPSIAGAIIVKWICSHGAEANLLGLLSLPAAGHQIDTPTLVLLFLYGNLFCYVASYPVLVFHATRVLDFANDTWRMRIFSDGYITALLLVVAAFLSTLAHQGCRYWVALTLASAFSLVQLYRLWTVLFARIRVDGCNGVDGAPGGTVSYAYGYSYALARRRGKSTETETTTGSGEKQEARPASGKNESAGASGEDEDDEQITTKRRILWHKDYMETYRHLREHGNSAFIFLLELGLGALAYSVVTGASQLAQRQLSSLGVLFAIWAIPAIFVHLVGQHLERRFSWFDRRINKNDERQVRS